MIVAGSDFSNGKSLTTCVCVLGYSIITCQDYIMDREDGRDDDDDLDDTDEDDGGSEEVDGS